MATLLRTFGSRDPDFIISYGLLDSQGINVIDSDPENVGEIELGQDYFRKPLQTGRGYVSSVQFFPDANAPNLYFSHPVFDFKGDAIGVLRIRYDAAVLEALVQESVDFLDAGLHGTVAQNDTPIRGKLSVIVLDENYLRLVDLSKPDLNFKTVVPLEARQINQLRAADRLPAVPSAELSTNLPDFKAGLANAATQPNFTGTAHPGEPLEQGAVAALKEITLAGCFCAGALSLSEPG